MAASAKSIQPFLTAGGVSYLIPKKGWWGIGNYGCMREMEKSNPGTGTALQMFEAKAPQVFEALRGQGVDLRDDLHAVGAYACGGEMCAYGVMKLVQPDRLHEILEFVPNRIKTEKIDAAHYTVTLSLATGGERVLHLRWVPLDWSAVPAAPGHTLIDAQRSATHLVMFYGVNAGKPVPDPFADLAAPAEAVAKVKAVEKLADPPSDRCLVGDAGELHEDGFSDLKLRGAQFVLAAPPRLSSDSAARGLDFGRSVDIEVALFVEGKPSQRDATRWVDAGKAWAGETLRPAMGMLSGMFGSHSSDMGALLEAAFAYRVEGNAVRLSFGTRNISEGTLNRLGVR